MIYIANRTLETADRIYRPGDAILDFDKWNEHARRAHLSQGNVERLSEPLGDRPTGRSKAEIEAEQREEQRLADELAAAASPDDPESAGADDRTLDGAGEGEVGNLDLEPLRDGDMYTCPSCEGFIAGTEEGMIKHLDKMHGGEIPPKKRGKQKVPDKEFAKVAPPPSPSAKHVKAGSLAEAAIKAAKGAEEE